jgi:hypothetical protein
MSDFLLYSFHIERNGHYHTLDKLAQIAFNTCLGKSAGLLLQKTRVKNLMVSSLTLGFLLDMDAITSSWIAAIFV